MIAAVMAVALGFGLSEEGARRHASYPHFDRRGAAGLGYIKIERFRKLSDITLFVGNNRLIDKYARNFRRILDFSPEKIVQTYPRNRINFFCLPSNVGQIKFCMNVYHDPFICGNSIVNNFYAISGSGPRVIYGYIDGRKIGVSGNSAAVSLYRFNRDIGAQLPKRSLLSDGVSQSGFIKGDPNQTHPNDTQNKSAQSRPKHSLGPISRIFLRLQIPNFALVPLLLIGVGLAILGFKCVAYAADTKRDIFMLPGFLICLCGGGIAGGVLTWIASPY